jgi:hypothetical protein
MLDGMKWLVGLALGYMLVTLVPDAPFAVGGSLDAGWMYGLNLAASQGMVFGRDVAFTYGPWGHLLFPLPPALQTGGYMALVFGLLASVGASVGLVVWRLGRDAAWAVGVLWACGLLGYQIATELPEFGLVAAAMAALAWVRTGGPPAWAMGGLAILTAAAFLTKGTHFVLGIGIMACLAVVSRGRGWWAGLLLPLTMAAAFRGDVRSCAQYVWSIFELSAGYSESMTLAGPWPVYHLGLLAVFVLLVGIPFAARAADAWPGALMAIPLAFLAFRHAFTRQDQHSDPFLIRLALASTLILILMPKGWGRQILSAACLLAALQGAAYLRFSGAPIYSRALDHLMLSGVRQTMQLSGARIEREARAQMPAWPESVRNEVRGRTVEVIPFQTWRAASEHLNWRPRPVFQTYSAYTPGLDQWNARFLRDRGAERIVHEGGVIDDRQLLWEDPASSFELAANYRVATRTAAQLVLERTATRRLDDPVRVSESVLSWGQDAPVPEGEGIPLASIRIQPSVAGRLYGLLVRTPAVQARARLTNGYTVSRRVVFRNLVNGVLTDCFENSLDAIARVVEGPKAGLGPRVHMLGFETGSPWAFQPQFRVTWSRVRRRDPEMPPAVAPLPSPAWTQGQPAIWSGDGPGRASSSGTASLLWPLAGSARTVVVRIRAMRPAVVALSWGDHGGPHRMEAGLPRVGAWQDVYFQTSLVETWRTNRGTSLGLQIQTEPAAQVEVEKLWMLEDAPPQPWLLVQVWPPALHR